jgi:hypothetical protein
MEYNEQILRLSQSRWWGVIAYTKLPEIITEMDNLSFQLLSGCIWPGRGVGVLSWKADLGMSLLSIRCAASCVQYTRHFMRPLIYLSCSNTCRLLIFLTCPLPHNLFPFWHFSAPCTDGTRPPTLAPSVSEGCFICIVLSLARIYVDWLAGMRVRILAFFVGLQDTASFDMGFGLHMSALHFVLVVVHIMTAWEELRGFYALGYHFLRFFPEGIILLILS